MKILKVPYIDQSVLYPTGCESVSAVMLLRYLGIEMAVDTFIERYLPCTPMEERNGELYGPNPNVSFCGSPYDENSFGCYAPVLKKALEKAAEGRYYFVDETGTPMDELLTKYIDRDMPVVFWACINMRQEIIGPRWKLLDTGEAFTWVSNEHCMLLVGYDAEGYYFNDPYDNNGIMRYPRELTEKRHPAQHQMAVGCICRSTCELSAYVI